MLLRLCTTWLLLGARFSFFAKTILIRYTIDMRKLEIFKYEASWCGPCKSLTPTWLEAEKNYPGVKFTVVSVEDDNGMLLARKNRISSIPVVIMTENGVEVERFVGASKNAFYDMLNRWI